MQYQYEQATLLKHIPSADQSFKNCRQNDPGILYESLYINSCTNLQTMISYVSYSATLITTCKILGSHRSDAEDSSNLRYDAVLLDE